MSRIHRLGIGQPRILRVVYCLSIIKTRVLSIVDRLDTSQPDLMIVDLIGNRGVETDRVSRRAIAEDGRAI